MEDGLHATNHRFDDFIALKSGDGDREQAVPLDEKCLCHAGFKPGPLGRPLRHECKGDGLRNPWNLEMP